MRLLFIIGFVLLGQVVSAQIQERELEFAKQEDVKEDLEEDKDVLIDVEIRAEFPKGIKQFDEEFSKLFILPDTHSDRESLLLVISFIVEKDGSIQQVNESRGNNKYFKEEAKRVMDLLGRWKPAMHKGEVVRHKITRAIRVFNNSRECVSF